MSEEYYKNRKEALAVLQQKGKISQGAFYGYCEKGGYTNKLGAFFPLVIRPDKTISKFQVLQFAMDFFGPQKPASSEDEQAAKADRLKRIAESEMAVRKNERDKRQMDDEWLQRHDAIKQMAAMLGNSRSSVLRRMHKCYPEVIRKCGGDQAHGNEIYEYLRSVILDGFNDVCHAGKIEGVLVKDKALAPAAE